MKVSLIIPCYNEANNLSYLLIKIDELIKNSFIQVILVDNGSSDGTKELIEKYAKDNKQIKAVIVKKNIGYGHGIIQGLKKADGDILSWSHADMQTDPLDIIKGLKFFEKNGINIFVKGKRKNRPILDTFFTISMSIFETFYLKKLLWDINAQPTMFSRKLFKSWKNPPTDFSLDLFAYYQAKKSKISVFRFPVKFSERLFGASKWNINWSSKRKFIIRTIEYSIKLKKDIL